MDDTPVSLRGIYESLLRARNLECPSAEPLHTYRFSREELDSIRQVLRARGHRALEDRYGAALFVAHCAEWFRRDRDGGHWDWIRPLENLGIAYHASNHAADINYGTVREAVVQGLRLWRRRIPGDNQLISAVVRESGFPASAAREGSIGTWLRRSVLRIEDGFAPRDAVRAEAWRVRDGLVQNVFEPAVALATFVADMRAQLPQDAASTIPDSVSYFDQTLPRWRETSPFVLEDADFKALVDDLVRLRGSNSGGLCATRNLRLSAGQWRERVSLTLSGSLDARRVPRTLLAALDGLDRVRVQSNMQSVGKATAIAVLDRSEMDGENSWTVRPLVQEYDVSAPLRTDLRLSVIAGDKIVAEFVPFAGEALTTPALVLQAPPGVEMNNAVDLEAIGTGSIRSTRPWLALAVSREVRASIAFENEPHDLGLSESDLLIVAFRGEATLSIEGRTFKWRSGDDRDQAQQLVLVGEHMLRVRESVFLGCPTAYIQDGEVITSVSANSLHWRPNRRVPWRSTAQHAPLGKVDFCALRGGELVGWVEAHVLPKGFRIVGNLARKVIRMENISGATVAYTADSRPVVQDQTATIDLSRHPPGSPVKLLLEWQSQVQITISDPTADPMLLAPSGQPSELHGSISVDRLHGYQLLAPEPRRLILEGHYPGKAPCRLVREVDQLTPLIAFQDDIRALLGSTGGLDGEVRLYWEGPGRQMPQIRWYDCERALEEDACASNQFRDLAPTIKVMSLPEPSRPIMEASGLSRPLLRQTLSQSVGQGPWLLFGTTVDKRILRPQVVSSPDYSGASASPLVAAMQTFHRVARDQALAERLSQPEQLLPSELRLLVELCAAGSTHDLPCACMDALSTLVAIPRALPYVLARCSSIDERRAVLDLQDDLPLLWSATPLEDWGAAFSVPLRDDVEVLRTLDLPVESAKGRALDAMTQIVDMEPGLRAHVRFTAVRLVQLELMSMNDITCVLQGSDGDLNWHADQAVTRHADKAWFNDIVGLAALITDELKIWSRYEPQFADILAAPFVVAKIASGKRNSQGGLIDRCRAAWIHDRVYFDAALSHALQYEAQR